MTQSSLRAPAVALFIALAGAACGETTKDSHAGHTTAATKADSPATTAFRAASARMHETMAIPYTNNADVDFIAGMIPHHQGAVDAARIVLKYGTDPEVRKFAEAVIAAQEAEISWMSDWLAKQPQ